MDKTHFNGKKRVMFGDGVGNRLRSVIRQYNSKRPFLISFSNHLAIDSIARMVNDLGSQIECMTINTSGIKLDINELLLALTSFESHAPDIVIGIGGGHVMDLAKLVSLLQTKSALQQLEETGEYNNIGKSMPLILIPTTAGSGSEATNFAVLYNGDVKLSIQHDDLFPDLVLLDPELSASMPAYQTACSGLDVICQSIESLWSTNVTEHSRHYSIKALKLAWSSLVMVVNHPDKKNRSKILMAAHLAGKAINIAKTTGPHACSYALTTLFAIPHGHAVALWMPFFLKFNCETHEGNSNAHNATLIVEEAMKEIMEITGSDSVDHLCAKFNSLLDQLQVKRNLNQFELGNINSDQILPLINVHRLKNNPRRIDHKHIRNALESELV